MGIAMWDSNKGYVTWGDGGLIGVCTEEGGQLDVYKRQVQYYDFPV